LVEAGYDVVGITMKMYAPTKPAHAKSCCGADDFDDARRSAQTLGIPHYVLDSKRRSGKTSSNASRRITPPAARPTRASRATIS